MTEDQSAKIYILFENDEWLVPLAQAMEVRGISYEGMRVVEGSVDLSSIPPQGLFFNRLSASSHTRGHVHSIALGGAMLRWLAHHGRVVVNGRDVLDLEVRKFDQYALLEAAGVRVPHTVATCGVKGLVEAADAFSAESGGPFIVKPNRGGKGLGVRLFDSITELTGLIDDVHGDLEKLDFISEDGVHLVQEYIVGKEKRILRNEFIGGQYYYSVEVNTADGFELCPADTCCIADARPDPDAPKFKVLDGFVHPLKNQYEAFLKTHSIAVAAFESIEGQDGQLYTYDINTNTNYNRSAEDACASDVDAYGAVADYLGALLEKELKQVA